MIPAVANDLVLWDFDDGMLDELARRFGIEQMLPAGAWRVRTVDGTHLYTSAPPGRAGLKVEVTPTRITVFKDGYLLAPGGRHPDGLVYELENVDVDNDTGRPPAVSTELYDLVLELAGQGRAGVGNVIDGGGPIAVGDRHVALRHLAGRLRGEGLGRKAIEAALEELGERFVEPLENQRELRGVVDWIMSKPAPPPLDQDELELLALLDELPDLAPEPGERQIRQVVSWEQPVPLSVRLPVPPFPLDLLPGWQRDWAAAVAREKGASVDLTATLSLGVIAGGVARHVVVTPRAGWVEPINLYLACALDPGQRKTPAYKAAFRPVRALERRRILEWEEHAKLVAISGAIYDKRRRELIGDSADDEELSPELLAERAAALYEGLGETKETPKPRLLTEDVTPEGLASLLADHGRIVAASDEGAILFENFSGRYAHGSANWDLLNKAHSAGDLVVDRKTSGTAFVWDPALTLVLATQPRVLADLWGKPGAEARGVLARPLYALPNPVYEMGRTPAADADVLVEYERRVRALYEDVPVLMFDGDDRPLPLTLRLDPEAETLFERYELELAGERRRLGISENAEHEAGYLGWLSKLAGQTARLAACLHAGEHWSNGTTMNTTIDADTVADAVELARYFHAHARVVFGLMGELPEQRRAQTILGWLKGRGDNELATLSVRDVHRSRGRGTTAEQVRTALRLLEDHGYVQLDRQKPAKHGGRPSERVHVNPALRNSGVSTDETDETSERQDSADGSVGYVTSNAEGLGVEHRNPGCQRTRAWRARDGVWRCTVCSPPSFPEEVLEERAR